MKYLEDSELLKDNIDLFFKENNIQVESNVLNNLKSIILNYPILTIE